MSRSLPAKLFSTIRAISDATPRQFKELFGTGAPGRESTDPASYSPFNICTINLARVN
jgi:hypothetical protein